MIDIEMKRDLFRRRLCALALRAAILLAGFGGPIGFASAQNDDDRARAAGQRERIASERKRLEAQFATEQKQCYQRFAVNDCLKDSRTRRREALAALRREEIEIDDLERRRKAAEQQQRIAERERERVRKAAAAEASTAASAGAPTDGARSTKKPVGRAGSAEPRGGRAAYRPLAPRREPDMADAERRRADAAAKRAERAAESDENAARHERKLQEAAEHKARVLRESAEKGKSAKPLPAPAALN